jgi:hypothetical protein
MNTPIVAPTLDYLRTLKAAGHQPTDIDVVMLKPGLYRIRVYTDDGREFEFHVEADRPTFAVHHREAVAYTGFGERGLSNLIYADALAKSKDAGLPPERINIILSEQCLDRVRGSLPHWASYGFRYYVRNSLSGMSYMVELPSD